MLAARGALWVFAAIVLCAVAVFTKPLIHEFMMLPPFSGMLLCGLVLVVAFALRLRAKSGFFMGHVLKAMLVWCALFAPFLLNDMLVHLSCGLYPGGLGWLGYECAPETARQPLAVILDLPVNHFLLMVAALFDFLLLYYVFAPPAALRPIRLLFMFLCFTLLLGHVYDFSWLMRRGANSYRDNMFLLGHYHQGIAYLFMTEWTDRLLSLPLMILGVEPIEFSETRWHSLYLICNVFFSRFLHDPWMEAYALGAFGPDPAGYPPDYVSFMGRFAGNLFYSAVMWLFWFVFMRRLVQDWMPQSLPRTTLLWVILMFLVAGTSCFLLYNPHVWMGWWMA